MNQDQIVKVYKQWQAELPKFQAAHGIICPIRAAVFIKRFSNTVFHGWNETKFFKYIEQQRQDLADMINDEAFGLEVKWDMLKPITVPVGYFAACRPDPKGPVKFGFSLCKLEDLRHHWPTLGKLKAIQCPLGLVKLGESYGFSHSDKIPFLPSSVYDKELDFDVVKEADGRYAGVARVFALRVWEQLNRFEKRCDKHFKLSEKV